METRFFSITAFRDQGYLQEVNRRFFHPLGLALVTEERADGTETLYAILDHRDDPEGMCFEVPDAEKAAHIEALWQVRAHERLARLGYVVQPAGHESVEAKKDASG